MAAVSGTCTDNPRLGRVGCGATFGGEMQHCIAKAPWSTHADGMVHITAKLSTIELLWAKGGSHPANPVDLGMTQDDRGVWRRPMSDEARERLASVRGGNP